MQFLQEYNMNKKRAISVIEMFLVISMTITTSYLVAAADSGNSSIIYENNGKERGVGDTLAQILEIAGKILVSQRGIVSALDVSDLKKGIWSCLEGKDGSICQEYPASECSSKCKGTCIPSPMSDVEECELGTCIDSSNGGCDRNVPQSLCDNSSNLWWPDPYANIPQCRPYCCFLGGNSAWITATQCEVESKRLGLKFDLRTDVKNSLECSALSLNVVEGACIYGKNSAEKNLCKFTTEDNCKKTIKGDFRQGKLCSNPELNTVCEKQKSTGCFLGKDEVYWFDSCGNRENIYSSGSGSWNDGNILAKNDSCVIGTPDNPLANSGTCGNCNQLFGSVCAKSSSRLTGTPNFDCRDLNCIDKDGKDRYNGESWCEYQGSIGEDGSVFGGRSTDTVGSRHFRKSCVKGEVIAEPCADYRNEICVESKTPVNGSNKIVSSSACRINMWQQCLSYNSNKDKKESDCSANNDCFLKSVEVGDFNFKICSPRYPPGFAWSEEARGEGAEALCKMTNMKCTKVEVKKLVGVGFFGEPKTKWVCKGGCECDTPQWAEQMNDLCTSFGDCGTKVNYQGTLDNAGSAVTKYKGRISPGPFIGSAYSGALRLYADENKYKGQYARPGKSLLGGNADIPEGLGAEALVPDAVADAAEISNQINTYAGMAGFVPSAVAWVAGQMAATVGAAASTAALSQAASLGADQALANYVAQQAGQQAAANSASGATSSAFSAFAGVLAGATIGFAITSLLLGMTGVSRGIPEWMSYSLMAAGTVAGALIGASLVVGPTSGPIITALGAGGPVGWIILIIVVVIIIVLKVIGVGEVRKHEMQFQCNAWQAPNGGNECSKCGKDGFACSQYACESLGQTCGIINENSDNPECIDLGKNDVLPPVIKPLKDLIIPDWLNYTTLDEFNNYAVTNLSKNVNISALDKTTADGFAIIGPGGCIAPYTQLVFGLNLNEPGICRYSLEHTNSFDKMETQFGISKFYRRNITAILPIPPREVNSSNIVNMYLRCKDKKGNVNLAEYQISFCINKGLDVNPPNIIRKDPDADTLKFGDNMQNITLYTDEPAECRWDSDDRDYNLMANKMECQNDVVDDIFDWKCWDTFKIKNNDSAKFFVRCKDQPRLANKSIIMYEVHSGYDRVAINNSYTKAGFVYEWVNVSGMYYYDFRNYTYEQSGVFGRTVKNVTVTKEEQEKETDRWFFETLKLKPNSGEKANVTKKTILETEVSDITGNNPNIKTIFLPQGRNINQQSRVYVLNVSKERLTLNTGIGSRISIVNTTNKLNANSVVVESGTIPATYTLSVRTSGGVNGRAECKYSFRGGIFIPFADTWKSVHTQTFSNLFPGNTTIPIECRDIVGNTASGSVRIEVRVDLDSPKITRTYSSGSAIAFTTNEQSTCVYSEKDCDYSFVNGTVINDGFDLQHNFGAEIEKTYYVKCKDRIGNGPGSQCNLVVKMSRTGAQVL